MLNGLDLFSGIGGISIALSEWVKTVAYCEQDRYAQAVLLSRMADGHIERAPIWDDIKTLKADMLPRIDIVFGGFPCQDISVAGLGKGLEGERSGLFFEIIRLCSDLRPRFIFLENVPAIAVRGLDRVCLELASLGYDCRWTIVSAAEMGAHHLRQRWFLLAHANGSDIRDSNKSKCSSAGITRNNGEKKPMANSMRERLERYGIRGGDEKRLTISGFDNLIGSAAAKRWQSSWSSEPSVGRVANGVSSRVDRIKCLGNSVVPIQAREAFIRLAGIESSK